MHLANLTTARLKRTATLIFTIFIYSLSHAQENSPYSRYGMGDLVPNRNMVSRSMGGIAAGYSDYQSLNLNNPASLGFVTTTIFDLGGEISRRTLKSNISPDKFTSTNVFISYLQLGFPIASKKMLQKGNYWGVSFGLRPLTQVNYRIEKNERVTGVDSINTIYEGTGGLNQANISTGIKIKNLSLGVSGGYSFGNKDYSTLIDFKNDSVIYAKSNSAVQTTITGFFVNVGAQYDIKTKKGLLRLGAYANLQQNLKAKRDNINETVAFDGNGGTIAIDTVDFKQNISGTIKIPATYSGGFTYVSKHWVFGADIDFTNWDTYTYYGIKDAVQNSWTIRAGGQYYPAKENTPASKYWSFVKYRAGIYYGPDYIKLNKSRPDYGVTFGVAFPLTSLQRLRFGEFVTLNTGIEVGARGDKSSQSIRENIARFSFGISMNARWFQKQKYD
ncbi:MAG: hypothetical protein ABJA37_10720 [Ferruginibacter sp.]